MRVTTADHYLPRPGAFVRFTPEPTPGEPCPVPPSFDQFVHLSAAARGTIWLAAAFDVPGRVDGAALAGAYRALIARHGTLRSSFVAGVDGPLRLRHVTPAALHREPAVGTGSAIETRDLMCDSLNRACAPFGHPSYLLGAIERDDTSTVLCGFDHAHVDGYSIALLIEDLRRLYLGTAPESLPPTGDFVDHCAERAEVSVAADDPRLRGWLDFFGTGGATPPVFPLDLGVPPGMAFPQRVELRRLLDARAADRFDLWCRSRRAGVFAGCVTAMAHALRALGGGDRLPLLFPMHIRHEERWRAAVGWFTTNAPLTVVTGADPAATVRATGAAVRAAIGLGALPVAAVLPHVGGLRMARRDVFMASYIDYRRLPGARHHRGIGATHISATGTADDAQFWLSRGHEGLDLRVRYPDTPVARAAIGALCDELGPVLGFCARDPAHTVGA